MFERKHRPEVLYWAVVWNTAKFFLGQGQYKFLRYASLGRSSHPSLSNLFKYLGPLPHNIFFTSFPQQIITEQWVQKLYKYQDERLPEVHILKMGKSLFIDDQKTEANLLKNLSSFFLGGQLCLQLFGDCSLKHKYFTVFSSQKDRFHTRVCCYLSRHYQTLFSRYSFQGETPLNSNFNSCMLK